MSNRITKYEKARVLAIRATQIANNSKPKIELPEGMIDPLKIAEYEYDHGVLNLTIERVMPDGEKIYISTSKN